MASLLDTSVVSQRIKVSPDERVVRWLAGVSHDDTFLSVITIQELRTGMELLPAGRKRRDLESWLVNDVRMNYAGRILPITDAIADLCGRLLAQRRKAAETAGISDLFIAATAMVHGLTIATLNRKHFERLGVELVKL